MPVFILYLFKVSVCLGVIYLFYYLVLRNLTFYTWNRWYLLLGTAVSFLIPLINVMPFLGSPDESSLKLIYYFPSIGNLPATRSNAANVSYSGITYWYKVMAVVFWLGLLFRGSKLLLAFISFYRLRRMATCQRVGRVIIYQVKKNILPFSFGNAIFINNNFLTPTEQKEIIRHELAHIEQKHTLDVLWLELVCLLHWFNPFAHLLKQAGRENLEFLADSTVLMTTAVDKRSYQYLLLKVTGTPQFPLANQFNFSSLKTRITMMNKMQSNKWEIGKFLFVLPMMALLLLACQEDVSLTDTNNASGGLVQEVPPPPPLPEMPPPPPPVKATFNFDDFLKLNPTIKNIIPEVQGNEISSMVVDLKSGKREVYNFKNDTELILFMQRYKNFPVLNLPPPPPPVVLPASVNHTLFMERNPQVELLGWQGDKRAVIFLKSGEREEYDLNNPESKAKAEIKYGKLPEFNLPESVTQFTPPVIVKNK